VQRTNVSAKCTTWTGTAHVAMMHFSRPRRVEAQR
jgi:hypothetical protein